MQLRTGLASPHVVVPLATQKALHAASPLQALVPGASMLAMQSR
jgi:hypothetical protein